MIRVVKAARRTVLVTFAWLTQTLLGQHIAGEPHFQDADADGLCLSAIEGSPGRGGVGCEGGNK